MRIEQAMEIILAVLKEMKNGEVLIIVRGGEVKHINTLQEAKFYGKIEEE